MKKILILLLSTLFVISTLSACVLPATTAPAAQTAPKTQPTSPPPTLAIKTPIPTATNVASFQEILSGTQTAMAIIRKGTPEEAVPTLEAEATEIMAGMGDTTPATTVNPLATVDPFATVDPLAPKTTTSPAAFGNATLLAVTPTATPVTVAVFQGIPGVPTFGILKVTRDTSVTIQTNEFPPNTKYVVKMGWANTYALGGINIGTFDSGKGGTMNIAYNIPADLKGADRIDIRVEFPDGRYCYNFFYNLTVN